MSDPNNLTFAYADPPYPGQSKKHYGDHPDYAGEVDHPALLERLHDEYPDGWALSTDSNSLRDLLPLCAGDCRVMAWVKPFASWKKGVHPPYAWEPVIFRGGRNTFGTGYGVTHDWVSAMPPVFRGERGETKGRKPDEFCFWLFACFGAMEGDTLADLFPGSSAVGRAWETYIRSPRLDLAETASQIEIGEAA